MFGSVLYGDLSGILRRPGISTGPRYLLQTNDSATKHGLGLHATGFCHWDFILEGPLLRKKLYCFNFIMVHCVNCDMFIPDDDEVQHYYVKDMGVEIISRIEQNTGNELPDDGELCEQCVVQSTETLPSQDVSVEDIDMDEGRMEEFMPLPHDTNLCVWCRSSLYQRRSHSIPRDSVRNLIAERIHPRQIPPGGLVCYACWVYIQQLLPQEVIGLNEDPALNRNECVWCTRSLATRRRHSLPEGPERSEIEARIFPRQIPEGSRVCYACWVSARRNVQRRNEGIPDVLGPLYNVHQAARCAWCETSLHRRQTHSLTPGPEREVVMSRIHPRELPENALVCLDCWSRAQQPQELGNIEGEERMSLDEYRITTRSNNSCFVPGCRNSERNRVPLYLRKDILSSNKIFVTGSARVCEEHKHCYNWDFLNEDDFSNTFSKTEIQQMVSLASNELNVFVNFEDLESINENVMKYFTGVTETQFCQILDTIPMLATTCKIPKTALGCYLIKNRTGDSHERIASLLQISVAKVCRLLKCAREALTEQFVPLHIGIMHLSREDLLERNLIIPEGLFGDREEGRIIIIMDGTYVYLQKSSNYLFQKKSYSLHKYRNLVKPFLLVASDGHIIDIFGPYPATTSDADIIKALFQDENSPLRRFFRVGDVFILDRGFRDSIELIESLGFTVHKPESLEEGETQLSTENANKSRCVTLCRWVVEVVNGRFKRDYKIFRSEFFNLAATHLMEDFRICGALINAFHPHIEDRPDAELILNRALSRLHLPNELADHIINNRINRLRAGFSQIDEHNPELDVFPQMNHSDLILFGLGIYQIKQARSYYGEHIRQNGSFVVEICRRLERMTSSGLVLLRGRIRSRHHSNRMYYTYISICPQGVTWEEKINEYYCSCVCGRRTVGCCAHVMTIVWYLGWARHQQNIAAPAAFLDGILVRDDIENEDEV